MKDTSYYFSHDYNTRQDIKIKKLLVKHGMIGYGCFWSIIEDLYNNANALPLDYESIAYDLRVSENVIDSIINDFDLFIIEGNEFGSKSVEKRLEDRNEKSTKARLSALKRWGNKTDNANALQSESEPNAIKERKVKEIKEKENNIFDFKKSLLDLGINETLVKDWLVVRKTKKASNTETALNSFLKEVEISGLELSKVIEMCVYKSWVGFEAKWLTKEEQKKPLKQNVSNAEFFANMSPEEKAKWF